MCDQSPATTRRLGKAARDGGVPNSFSEWHCLQPFSVRYEVLEQVIEESMSEFGWSYLRFGFRGQ